MALQNKVFVGSLQSGTKPEALRHLFEKHGEVVQCDVVNRCGFVYMQTPELVEKCVKALNGTQFNGHKIVVEVGRPDKKATAADGAAKPKRARRGSGKNPIRAVAPSNGTIGANKRNARTRGGINPAFFADEIPDDLKEAVGISLVGVLMDYYNKNPNSLNDMQGIPNARQPQGGNYGAVGGPSNRQRGNGPRPTGGPPSGNRNERPPKQQRNNEIFTRRPKNEKVNAPTGPIKGKVTKTPPSVVPPKADTRRRGQAPNKGGAGSGPGPRPNGLPRGNDGFGHNNAPNMNFSNGSMRGGGSGRHSGGGGGGSGGGRGDGGNANNNNNSNQFYTWRNESQNGRSNTITSGGSGGGGSGMNRAFNDNFGGNSNSMFNQGGGGGAMGQDRRGFALPDYQQQQQHHHQLSSSSSAFMQSNFEGCLPNPGGFTTGVSNVVSSGNDGGMSSGNGGGSGFGFSSNNGQNMSLDNRGVGGFRSNSGFMGNRSGDNTDNGGSGFGGFDNNSRSRGNFNSNNSNNNNNHNSQMYQNEFPPLNNSSGNMHFSSGGFNRSGGMNSNNMHRNVDPWQSVDNRRFN